MSRVKRPRILTVFVVASSQDFDHLPLCGLENMENGTKRIWFQNMANIT